MTRSRPTWAKRQLVAEAVLNLTAPGSRLLLPAVVASLCGVLLSWNAAVEWRDLAQEVDDRVEAGWATFAVEGEDATLGAATCVDLEGFEGVSWAAATQAEGEIRFLGGTQAPLRGIVGSPSARGVAGVDIADLYIGADLADHLEIGPGGRRVTTMEHGPLMATRALEGRGTDLGGTVLVPAVFDQADSCRFQLEPAWVDRHEDVMAAQIDVTGMAPQLRRLAVVGEFERSPYDRYLERPGRWFPLASATVIALLVVASALRRGSEIATYRVVGTRSVDVCFLLGVETVLISLIFSASALTTSAFLRARSGGIQPPGHLQRIVASALLIGVITLPAWAALASRNVSRHLKDR